MEELTPEARAAVEAGKTLYADSIESLVRAAVFMPVRTAADVCGVCCGPSGQSWN